jgi:hypothetical protein
MQKSGQGTASGEEVLFYYLHRGTIVKDIIVGHKATFYMF